MSQQGKIFENELPRSESVVHLRGIDADGNSVSIPMSVFYNSFYTQSQVQQMIQALENTISGLSTKVTNLENLIKKLHPEEFQDVLPSPTLSVSNYMVTISSSTDGALIKYTTDGSTPSATNGITYTGPFKPTADCTIKVIAISGNKVSSVQSFVYTAEVVKHSVTLNLNHCNASNQISTVNHGGSYSVTISPATGYNLSTVSCTMGGNNVTVTNGVINIPSVTGNIVITGTAVIKTFTVTKNLQNSSTNNSASSVNYGSSYNATITPNTGYVINSIVCTMGGNNVTVSGNQINIPSVTGNIVITVVTEQERPVEVHNFYVGQVNGTQDEFTALDVSVLLSNSTKYTNVNTASTVVTKYCYYLMLPSYYSFNKFEFISSGIKSTVDSLDRFNCVHSDVTIDGVTYKVYGYRARPFNLTYDLTLNN